MQINRNIGCYEVVARNSRGDAAIYQSHAVPDGWEVIQVGPPREYLLALLSNLDYIAAKMIGDQHGHNAMGSQKASVRRPSSN